jgi:predicted acyl esterase
VTLLGQPLLTGRVRAEGRFGQIAARLWDLDPAAGTQRLVTRGVYRLRDDERGRFRFRLDGNGWRFDQGHRVVVELLGRDEPAYGASPGAFSATLTGVQARLPLRERT